MTGIKDFYIAGMALAVFVFALMSFGLQFALTNNAPQSIGDEQSLRNYRSDINDTFTEAYSQSNSTFTAFVKDIPVLGQTIQILSISRIWQVITAPKRALDLTANFIFVHLFGADSAVAAAITTFITGVVLVIIVIYTVKFMRGYPD